MIGAVADLFEDTLIPAATTIREATPPPTGTPSSPTRTNPTVTDDDLESLAGDLLGKTETKDSADPFGLDDLLDEI